MVNFKNLTDKAKDVVEKRGGTDSVKEDAGELKDIFKSKSSLTDKAKAAASALKDPGAEGEEKPIAKTEEQPKPMGERDTAARERKRKAETKTQEQRAK
jgi:hypothetical protein